MNQVIVPGSLLWKREKRALMRRWKRAMLLPETILLAALIIGGSYASDHFGFRPGHSALASVNGVIQDGLTAPGSRRKQRLLQDRLRSEPQALMTLTGGDVMRAFDYADLQRQDGTVTLLQFRGKECILDVYMRESQTVHYEFRARMIAAEGSSSEMPDIRERACMEDLIRTRR